MKIAGGEYAPGSTSLCWFSVRVLLAHHRPPPHLPVPFPACHVKAAIWEGTDEVSG